MGSQGYRCDSDGGQARSLWWGWGLQARLCGTQWSGQAAKPQAMLPCSDGFAWLTADRG